MLSRLAMKLSKVPAKKIMGGVASAAAGGTLASMWINSEGKPSQVRPEPVSKKNQESSSASQVRPEPVSKKNQESSSPSQVRPEPVSKKNQESSSASQQNRRRSMMEEEGRRRWRLKEEEDRRRRRLGLPSSKGPQDRPDDWLLAIASTAFLMTATYFIVKYFSKD